MGDQSQPQGGINNNNYSTNMSQMFPSQMMNNMNLDNSIGSITGGSVHPSNNNQATSQMFDMFNNMMKMMMNQNGGGGGGGIPMNPMFAGMMNQMNVGGMGMANNQQMVNNHQMGNQIVNNPQMVNNQQMGGTLGLGGINGFGGSNNIPPQYQSQQQLKQNNSISLNNTANSLQNGGIVDNEFRNIQDRFNSQQNEMQSFYDKIQKQNMSPIGMKNNNPNLFAKKNNIQQPLGLATNSDVFELSSTSEQLPFKSEYIDLGSNFDQSQNFNYHPSNKQSFVSNQGANNLNINQNLRAMPIKDEDGDYFSKPQSNTYQKNSGSLGNFNMNNNNMINDRISNNNNLINQRNNFQQQPSDKKFNQSQLSEDNEFLRDSVVNMINHPGQSPNIFDNKNVAVGGRNQPISNKNINNNNNFKQGQENNDYEGYGAKHNSQKQLTDNDQQYLMHHLKNRNNEYNYDDKPNKIQNEYPLQQKNLQNRFINKEEEFEDEALKGYLPSYQNNKIPRQNFEEERPMKAAINQRNPYEIDQPLPAQNQKGNYLNKNPEQYSKNSEQYSKNNNQFDDEDKPIQPSQKNNYFDDDRPIKVIQKDQFGQGNESDRSMNPTSQRNYNNPIEEMPIKSKGVAKRFEDLIEEKMRQDDNADEFESNQSHHNNKKKTFLKKGTRTFLSNAQQRSKAAQNHIEVIGSQQSGGDFSSVSTIPQPKPKKSVPANVKSAQQLSSAGGSGINNQNNFSEKTPIGGKQSLNQIHSMGGLDVTHQSQSGQDLSNENPNSKQKKKFLQRGKGKGGGVQGAKKDDQTLSSTQIKDPAEKQQSNNQPKKNNEKKPPQQLKQKKASDIISLDEDDDYNPKKSSKVKFSDDEFAYNDDEGDEKAYGGRKYQPYKYIQDEEEGQDEENYYKTDNTKHASSQGNNNKNNKKEADESKNKFTKHENDYQFDDDEEWGENDTKDPKSNKNTIHNFANKSKVGGGGLKREDDKKSQLNIHDSDAASDDQGHNEDFDKSFNNDDEDEDNEGVDQQYSKVVQKYFNKKGSNNAKTGVQTEAGNPQKGAAAGFISFHNLTSEQKKQLISEYSNEKIEQLNSEISKFKLQNERVQKMRSKYEDLLKTFNKEKEQFAKQKELEIQELEEWKKEEQKKTRNEKRIAERQQKAVQGMPNRKEREEIEGYKAQIKKLQDDIKMRDQRNKLKIDGQKKQIDELTQKNSELLDEIKHLEKLRLDGGLSSAVNKSTNLSRTNSSKQPALAAKNPTKSPFKSKKIKNGESEGDEEDGGYIQKSRTQRQSNEMSRKRNHTYSTNYDYQYDNNTQFQDDDQYGQDNHSHNHHQNDDEDDENEEFENYENYQRDHTSSKGSKQAQGKNREGFSNDHDHYYGQEDAEEDEEEQEQEEDEHLETYEDIINFNPVNHQFNEKKSKNEVKQKQNLKSQHSVDIPSKQAAATASSIRQTSKSNSISIQNNNPNVNNSISTLSSANKNDKKKSNIISNNEKSEKENKQQSLGGNTQVNTKQTKPNNNKQKEYIYDITTLSQSKVVTIKMINEEIERKQFQYDQNIFYQNYLSGSKKPSRIVSENTTSDGKIQTVFEDGKNQVIFPNKVKRQVYPNGYTLVNFVNSDVKQVLPDSTIIYYFADAETSQTTLHNGINIYKFPNDQIEIHFPSGKKEIKFADGTEKFIQENGEEKTFFEDGTVQIVDTQRIKTIRYKNGKEDVIYPDQHQ